MSGRERHGPYVWANWRAASDDDAPAYEAALYTDAHVTGSELSGGPYRAVNALGTIGPGGSNRTGVGVVLQVTQHIRHASLPVDDYEKTWTKDYVGHLTTADQFACLLTLASGARFKDGGVVREFRDSDDFPFGRPIYVDHEAPALTVAKHTLLPRVSGTTIQIEELADVLATTPRLDVDQAVALVRAARQFRDALWIADDDPQLAWLLLVSAVEVAAVQHVSSSAASSELLLNNLPDLHARLLQAGGDELVAEVAGEIAHTLRSTQRFIDFFVAFDVGPPARRPENEWAQADWSHLPSTLRKIYKYRSDVLHAGLPWPSPMLDAPWLGDMTEHSERPMGLGTAYGSTTWAKDDTPMLLHTFTDLVHRTLLRWWTSLAVPTG